jgi:hypothetical protein
MFLFRVLERGYVQILLFCYEALIYIATDIDQRSVVRRAKCTSFDPSPTF